MKVLFVYPEIQSSVTNTATYSLPLGLGAIATFCHRVSSDKLETKILDGSMMTHAEQLKELKNFSPDVVGFSPTIASMGNAYLLAQEAHEAGALVVFGGVNSTNLWKQMLTNRSFIDAVVLFEGEEAMAEIIRRWQSGSKYFVGIPNVACRDNDGNVIGPKKIRVFSLDELPDIDYSLFDLSHYFRQTEERGFGRAVSYYAGKGCVKRGQKELRSAYLATDYSALVASMDTCSFCGRNELGFRCLPPERESRIIRELHDQYGVQGFFNVQDTVNLHCQEPIGLEDSWFRLFIGAESITAENIAILQHHYGSNLILQVGIEAATPEMRRAMGKAPISDIFAKVGMLEQNNIQLHASFIFGGRGETLGSMKATANLARKLADYKNVTWILVSPQIILPGSPDYRHLLKMPGMQEKWKNADLSSIPEISRDFLYYFTSGLTREMVLEEIRSTFADIRAKTPNRRLVLDIKGVIEEEEQNIFPRRYYC